MRILKKGTAVIAVTGLAGLALAGCGSSGSSSSSSTAAASSPSASTLSETGSTLLYPLFQAWAPAYQSHAGVSITPQGTGSGTGISEAENGTADIGASDAYLPPATVSANPGMMNIPLAISAQQINYHVPGITGHLRLDGTVLAKMYTGAITKWNDPAVKALNPGITLPNLKVVPVHRSDGSGDTFLFTSYLSKSAPSVWTLGYNTTVNWPSVPGALSAQGNGGMVSTCGQTSGCVAYIGISYLGKTQKAGLGTAELKNASGNYTLPTAATVSAEAASFASSTPPNQAVSMIYGPAPNGYPIINYEYAIINPTKLSSAKASSVQAFLRWAINPADGNATKFLAPVNFQPLPASQVTLSKTQINKI